jgi:hypothetical protein
MYQNKFTHNTEYVIATSKVENCVLLFNLFLGLHYRMNGSVMVQVTVLLDTRSRVTFGTMTINFLYSPSSWLGL